MKLAFRPALTEPDTTFVVSSWLDASRTSYSAGLVQMEDWYPLMWSQYVKATQRRDMRTVVAYEATDPSFLYGFMVADPTEQRIEERDGSVRWWPALVLFVFVKQNYRREGIARALFNEVGVNPAKPFLFGCNTKQATRLSAKVPGARFHPLVARFPKKERRA
jgi:GNAT superfamily N-acetyltransferase